MKEVGKCGSYSPTLQLGKLRHGAIKSGQGWEENPSLVTILFTLKRRVTLVVAVLEDCEMVPLKIKGHPGAGVWTQGTTGIFLCIKAFSW